MRPKSRTPQQTSGWSLEAGLQTHHKPQTRKQACAVLQHGSEFLSKTIRNLGASAIAVAASDGERLEIIYQANITEALLST